MRVLVDGLLKNRTTVSPSSSPSLESGASLNLLEASSTVSRLSRLRSDTRNRSLSPARGPTSTLAPTDYTLGWRPRRFQLRKSRRDGGYRPWAAGVAGPLGAGALTTFVSPLWAAPKAACTCA